MKKLFLLDAYALIYRAYYAFMKSPRINSKGLNTSAVFGFLNTLEDLLKREHPSHIAVVFDPAGKTFRHELYEDYKANREATPEDIRKSIPLIKQLVEAYRIPVIQVDGYEADDVIGTLSVMGEKAGYDVYMMTGDKDYGQLVTDHVFIYKPKFGSNDCEVLGVEQVKEKFGIDRPEQVIDLLGLMGDKADNIPGCPGVGEVTAGKLLKQFGSIDEIIARSGELKGAIKSKIEDNKEQIIFSRLLATIKIDVPVAFEEDKLIMEKPNEEALRQLFTELEFRTQLAKLSGTIPETPRKKAKAPVQSQLDLFGDLMPDVEVVHESIPEVEDVHVDNGFNSVKNTPHVYQTVESEEQIQRLMQMLMSAPAFAFDTETTSLDPFSCDIVGFSFAIKAHEAFYIPCPADRVAATALLNRFAPLFVREEAQLIGQNIKFDMLVLAQYGIHIKCRLFDTMVAHYLIQPELRHNMDYLAEILLNYQTIHIEELIGPKGKNQLSMSQVALPLVTEYAAEDADITLQLKQILEQQLTEQNINSLFYDIEMPLVKVLAEIEQNGVLIDSEGLKQSSVVLTRELNAIEREVIDLAGETINVSSPKQIGELLFDKLKIVEKAKKTKSGQYVTDEETLESMRSKHPIVGKILDYRGLKKLLSTYIDALPQLINPKTGKIHTSFNQTVAATGRLSSSNPNLQNIPIRDEQGKEIRKAFVAEPGCLFLSADYSQVELRIMAHLSGDKQMTEAFFSGHDIHAATAANIYKVPIESVTSDMRRKAKTANFGIIYGISVFGLSDRLNIPRGEAKALIDGYFETFPEVKAYMDKSIQVAREQGYVETLLHRKRYLADINSKNGNVRGFAERNAINAPIQGSAADIIKIAMIRIADRIKKEKLETKMILQVHDELNFNVPLAERDRVEILVREEMEHAVALSVPLKVDVGIGMNWLEAH